MATLAVIDLGTNTFHLLVVKITGAKDFTEVYRERRFINLAEEGIELINDQALSRAKEAILQFKNVLDLFEIKDIRILGTEALRKARNGAYFVKEVFQIIGHPVEIIGGLREADLIFKGVGLAIDLEKANHLIMDIGGGSVEFIISIKGEKRWSQSFPIGVAVLNHLFHHRDPITSKEIEILDTFLNEQLSPLFAESKKHELDFLTGASGSFEVISFILDSFSDEKHFVEIGIDEFYPIFNNVINSTYAERLEMKGIPEERAEMIVVAMYLIYFMVQKISLDKICVSDYAMKEGAIAEMQKIILGLSKF